MERRRRGWKRGKRNLKGREERDFEKRQSQRHKHSQSKEGHLGRPKKVELSRAFSFSLQRKVLRCSFR